MLLYARFPKLLRNLNFLCGSFLVKPFDKNLNDVHAVTSRLLSGVVLPVWSRNRSLLAAISPALFDL
jgi:hypothetical protein